MKFLILCVVSLFPSLVSACVGAHKDCTGFKSCCEPWVCAVSGSLTGPYKTCSCAQPHQLCGHGKSSHDKPGCCDGSPCGKDGKCPPGKIPSTGYSCPKSVTVDGKSIPFHQKSVLRHIHCFFGRSGGATCTYDKKSGNVRGNTPDTPSPSYCPAALHYTCPVLEGRTYSFMNVYHDTNHFVCWYKRPGQTTSDSTGCNYSLTDGKLVNGYGNLDGCPATVPR